MLSLEAAFIALNIDRISDLLSDIKPIIWKNKEEKTEKLTKDSKEIQEDRLIVELKERFK